MLKLESVLTKPKLEDLYLKQKLSDYQIGKIFNVSLGRIHRLRNRYNIKPLEQYQRHHKQELTTKEREFIVGTLLGDGHMRWRKGNKTYPELMLEQTVKHKEYVFWLKDQIKDWLFDPSKELKQIRKIKNGNIYHSYPIRTICHPVFIEFHKGFYKGSKKVINFDFLKDNMSTFSLAVWLMDDGTLSKNRNIAICTQSFNRKENEKLKSLLFDKFDLRANIWKSYEEKCWLGFSKEESIKLTFLVKDYMLESMKHKIITSSETTKGTDEEIHLKV